MVLGNHYSKHRSDLPELPPRVQTRSRVGDRPEAGSQRLRAAKRPPMPKATTPCCRQGPFHLSPAAGACWDTRSHASPHHPWSTGWPPSRCGSSPGEITAPFLQRLNPRSRNSIIRACQCGTQHCNRSSYQQLDTPPQLICARNTMTVLNRELDYLFKLFTKGWGASSVI